MSTNLDLDELQHVYALGLVDIALAIGEPVRLDRLGVLEGDFDDFLSNGVDVEQFIAAAASECEGILENDIASLSSLAIEGSDDWVDGRLRLAFRHLLLSGSLTYLRVAALARYFDADYDRVLAIAQNESAEAAQDGEEGGETGEGEDAESDDEADDGEDVESDDETDDGEDAGRRLREAYAQEYAQFGLTADDLTEFSTPEEMDDFVKEVQLEYYRQLAELRANGVLPAQGAEASAAATPKPADDEADDGADLIVLPIIKDAEPNDETNEGEDADEDQDDESEPTNDSTFQTDKIKIALQYLIDQQCVTPTNIAGLARHFAVSTTRIDQLAQTLARSSTSIAGIAENDVDQGDLYNALTTNTDGWVGVAGMQDLKATLERDVIGPLREPDLYKQYRLTPPNGFLFYGAPGCGKTFIARKLADRLGRNFKEFKPSDIGSIYIHGTQGLISEAFAWAEENAPSLLFFDEFDAMAPRRDGDDFAGKHFATEVNEFLAQLNECADKGILVIAATNQADKIDKAILRPGRLDKKILVAPPDEEARRNLFELEMRNRPQVGMDWDVLAQLSDGHTCAEIAAIVEEAARSAVANREAITMDHVSVALDRNPPQYSQAAFDRYARFDEAT